MPYRPPLRLLAHRVACTGLVLLLAACAAAPREDGNPGDDVDDGAAPAATSAWVQASDLRALGEQPGWQHKRFGQYRPTRYTAVEHAGRAAVQADSAAGNSTLRLPLAQPVPPDVRLRFSWFVPRLNTQADLRDADIDDAVVRVLLTFDGDRAVFRPRDHFLSEIVHLVTGEPLPFATLMYVWDHRYPVGSVIANPHTERIRMLVVQSGEEGLGRWNELERDVAADYRQVFGEAPGALTGIGLMSDSNNTGETVRAWFGPVAVGRAAAPAVAGSP